MEGMPGSIGNYYTNNNLPHPNPESSSSKLLLRADRRRINNGSEGSSPTQSLDQYHQSTAHHQQRTKKTQEAKQPNSDPDPPQLPSTAGPSNSITSPPPPPQAQQEDSAQLIRYHECLKNHAATMGGHVMDGCGEFMPSGDEGTTDAFKCAACQCHRNFHRKSAETETENSQRFITNNSIMIRRATNHHFQHHHQQFSHNLASPATAGPMMMAFGGASRGLQGESSSEDLNVFHANAGGAQRMAVPPFSKKRFRTKFSKEQKDRMHEVAEKLGWKIQKQDDEDVQRLCDELGVKRQVFKVWMHNNKQAMKKKQNE